mmetsp:Transcript_5370/g.11307  ORF Transcript_5370/g.11307 Transcript_5370/m.11307 type:complete len:82 (+) Transcript_5370:1858-2103(+)
MTVACAYGHVTRDEVAACGDGQGNSMRRHCRGVQRGTRPQRATVDIAADIWPQQQRAGIDQAVAWWRRARPRRAVTGKVVA